MRKLLLIGLVVGCCCSTALAQNRYFTKNGHISFFSKAPLEDIEAHTRQAVSFLDLTTGELVFSVPMKSFGFRKSLMQRHFNEKYVESQKFPNATFKGMILHVEQVKAAQDGLHQVQIEGVLTIHGVDRPLKTEGTLQVKGQQVTGKSNFSVSPQDFYIAIPRLLRNRISKSVAITVDMLYGPYVDKNP